MSNLLNEKDYLAKIIAMLQSIEETQSDAISAAAKAAFTSIEKDGLLHVFSTGHSHMIVEEMFYRAGGLAPISPLLDDRLMLHTGALTATKKEREEGFAKEVLQQFAIGAGDTAIVSSNSGINPVPIEAAMCLKEMGLTVVAVTSVAASAALPPRHKSGKKLLDIADIVIDNCAPLGDGLLTLPGSAQTTGGASTFGSLYIAQRIVIAIENLFLGQGKQPPIFMSANVPGGDDFNKDLLEKYSKKIRSLS